MYKRLSLFITILVMAVLWSFSTGASAQMLMCDSEVSLEQGRIVVAPTGTDDSDNIQCALDEATRLGIPVVKLLMDEYLVARIQVEDFAGSFEGASSQTTTLVIIDGSIDCQQMIEARQAPAALKFIRGNVRVARMAIGSNLPCSDGPAELFIQVHFTGQPAGAVCGSETGFGFIDRSALVSFSGSEGSQVAGVASIAEGQIFNDCNDTLLGTLKVNRSDFSGHYYGVAPMLRGSGQVDINFNEFQGHRYSVFSTNANQLMTIQANDFIKLNSDNQDHTAIYVSNQDDGPRQNRAVVFRNSFDLTESSSNFELTAIEIDSDATVATSVAITNNNVVVDSPEADVIVIDNARGASVASNTFSGEADSLVKVQDGSSGTTITANKMLAVSSDSADIVLEEDSTGVIVIGNEAASVEDQGSGNTVLNNDEAL